MRVLSSLILLVILVLSIVNCYKVWQLNQKVLGLQERVENIEARQSKSSLGSERARLFIKSAQEHFEKAERLLKLGDFQGAKKELDKASGDIEVATKLSASKSGTSLHKIVAEAKKIIASRAKDAREQLGRLRNKLTKTTDLW